MPRRIPSLQALSCFDAAARHESYTRAGQELALTQGAVSRQVAALEAFLGVALFRRTRHGVALTPAGTAYARQVAGRLDALERDTLDAMSGPVSGHAGAGAVHLAAVPTFATRWLLPRLPLLAQRHADIVVHVEVATRPFMFADSGQDAALYAGTPRQVADWAGTRSVLLMHEEVVPVASPQLLAKPARRRWLPADLAGLPLLQQSTRPEAWRQWFEAMGVPGVGASALQGPRYELFSMLAVAATTGMGVALVPRMLVEAELARGELAIVCQRPLRGQRGYYFVTPDLGPAQPPAVALLRDWLVELARGERA